MAKKWEKNKNFAWDMINDMVNRIADLTDEAASSEAFLSWLKVQKAFHRYSWNNSALISIQAAKHNFTPTKVMGGKKWEALGRKVTRNDYFKKKLWILAPIFRKDDNGESKLVYFKNVFVFDVSQTEGEPLPELEYRTEGDDNGLIEALENEYKQRGIKLTYVDEIVQSPSASGASFGGRVELRNDLEGLSRAATLAHELAHELLHWNDDNTLSKEHSTSTMEIEAESTAMVVLGAWGLEYEANAMYLACWNGDSKKVKESLRAIANTSKSILENILQEEKKVAA